MSGTRKRTTKTTEDVKSEFDDVVDKHSSSKTNTSTKEAEALARHQHEVLAKVAQLTPDKVMSTVGAVQLDVTKTLSQVSEILVEQTQQLQEVNEAIRIRKEELTQLHGKDVIASSIDLLLEQHEATKAKLENDMAEAKLAWAKERDKHEDDENERLQQQKQDRERNEAEYQYLTAQRRRAAEDAWNEQVRQAGIKERDRQEQLFKGWAQREETLKTQEDDVTKLRNEALEWPKKLEAEVASQKAAAIGSITREHKHELALLQRDAASSAQLAAQEIATLKAQLATTTAQVEALQTKLADANAKVTEVATKALESTSGQAALNAVTKFASESASNGPSKRS